MTYRIPATNLFRLHEEFTALGKRAAKLGVEAPTYAVVGEEIVTGKLNDGTEFRKVIALVEVTGVTPRLSGFSFVGVVEPLEDGINLVKALPGVGELPARFRDTAIFCNHCHTKRYRKQGFILRGENTGTHDGFLLIGRNCLVDFLGGKTPENIAAIAEFDATLSSLLEEGEGESWGGGRGLPYENTEAFLTVVAAYTRVDGFVSRGKAREDFYATATADQAWRYCFDSKFQKEENDRGVETTAIDNKRAQDALAWARDLEGKNDYEYNLSTVAKLNAVDPRGSGILASAIAAYNRFCEKDAERKVEATIVRKHVGTVGKREVFGPLNVISLRWFDNNFGSTALVRFEDADKNILVWWASNPGDIDTGDTVTVKGTVKAHDDYNGTPQTILTRCAVV